MLGRSRFHVPSVPGAGQPVEDAGDRDRLSGDSVPTEKADRSRARYSTHEGTSPRDMPADARRSALQAGATVRACGVTALHAQGRVDDAQAAAAYRWLADWLLGVEDYSDPTQASGGAGDAHTRQLARARAVSAVARVREALGMCAEVWLCWTLVDGLTWAEIAKRSAIPGRDRDASMRAQERAIMLLDVLADHYAEVDRACDKGRLSQVRPGRGQVEVADRSPLGGAAPSPSPFKGTR